MFGWTRKFWKDTAERAIRTVVQVGVPLIIGNGADLFSLDYKAIGGIVLTAGIGSIGTSLLASLKAPEQESASLLDQPVATVPGKHDGSQSDYDPTSERYSVAEQVDSDPVYQQQEIDFEQTEAEHADAPPSPFQSLVAPLPPGSTRQRDPKTGRYLSKKSSVNMEQYGRNPYVNKDVNLTDEEVVDRLIGPADPI